ncbi:MAG: signal peptidase II [Ruminococcaceae bacterium]|nr:signal peptidase II [Oscillospiraceae bacterium]
MWNILVIILLIGSDQLLKYWTVTALELGESVPFLPGLMQLTRVHNYGAAWSSFSGQTLFLVTVNVVMLAAVAWALWKLVRHPLGRIAGLLILGGGLGNVIDRVWHGYVVDMFDLLLFEYPVFNVADCFVVVGVILGAIYYLWFYEKYDKPIKKESDNGAHDPADHN